MSGSLFDQYKAALRRGHLAALAGNLDDALAAYQSASRLVPERALPLASQGTVLHRLDRWSEAADAFEAALRLAPDDEAALRARAGARADRGLRSGAAADFERLAFVLDVGGRSAEAAAAARRAADLGPSAARELLADRLAAAGAARADMLPAGHDLEVARASSSATPRVTPDAIDDAPPADVEPAAAVPLTIDAATSAAELEAADLETVWPGLADELVQATPAGSAADDPTNGQPDGPSWPPVDLPSLPPPPIEGPPPDPETLLAEAAGLIEAGDLGAARDRMLIAAMVHRDAGRLDAALEVCLQLLTTAPGDPKVHLAIANLQLDHGWTEIAVEKIQLLLRLTSLTGDTQAEADVHFLASERLRDEIASAALSR